MKAIFITLAAAAGVGILTSAFIPQMRVAAFGNSWGVTWVMVAALTTAVLTFKSIK